MPRKDENDAGKEEGGESYDYSGLDRFGSCRDLGAVPLHGDLWRMRMNRREGIPAGILLFMALLLSSAAPREGMAASVVATPPPAPHLRSPPLTP
jgi:hypothetical protein